MVCTPNQWISYSDEVIKDGNTAFAEIDILLRFPDLALPVVIECKLSQQATAWQKLIGLYGPLVQHITGIQPALVQVYKNATFQDRRPLLTCPADFRNLRPGDQAQWHVL